MRAEHARRVAGEGYGVGDAVRTGGGLDFRIVGMVRGMVAGRGERVGNAGRGNACNG